MGNDRGQEEEKKKNVWPLAVRALDAREKAAMSHALMMARSANNDHDDNNATSGN